MKTAAYFRVSTKGQGEDDRFGLPAQYEGVEKYASENGLEIVERFEDVGYSGATADRPGLAAMLERAGEFERVLVFRWDRLARDVTLDGYLRFRLKKAGALVLSATETNGVDPISDLTGSILAAVAQYERHLIAARLHNARKLKSAQGLYAGGRPPFGWQAPGDGTLVPHPEEHPIYLEARELRTAGKTFEEIASTLNAKGYRSRTSRDFQKGTVRGMLVAESIQ